MKPLVSFLLIAGLFFSPTTTLTANPINPEVISGEIEFPEEFTELLEITQSSNKAIIEWEGFSISAGEVTKFIQPGADASVLNRVTSGDTSSIEGTLEANGKVLLINPNGILFGAGARVDTAGFIASTLDVPDAEFLAGGDLRFSGASQAPVVNLGEITAENGDVFLVGATVQNAGTISAPNGTVGLAAGQQVLITAQGDERVFVEVGSAGSVEHSGAITAAQAELKAAGGNPKAMAVNVAGRVEATGVERVGGRVLLSAGGGGVRVSDRVRGEQVRIAGSEVEIAPEGDVASRMGMSIEASSAARIDGRVRARDAAGEIGGSIELTSPQIAVGATGRVEANGATAGGLIQLAADELSMATGAEVKANASADGDGGVVLASAPVTASIGGTLAARGRGNGNGGFVTVTGGDVDVTATGRLDTTGGADGGFVTVDGSGDVAAHGRIDARGQSGNGGFILMKSAGDLLVGATARLDAGGEIDGGFVSVEGENDVAVYGQLLARGRTGNGGQIFVTGDGDVAIGATALLDASGEVDGGLIQVEGGGDVAVGGRLLARGVTGNGGQILVSGDGDVSVGETGVLDASGGVDGGFVSVEGGGEVSIGGRLDASGGSGAGGFISVSGDGDVDVTATGALDASGATGGTILVDSANGDTTVHGTLTAVGNDGAGGHIEVTGENVLLGSTATVDASGLTGGGRVLIGGDFQGANPAVRNAQNTTIQRGATIYADALGAGNAGEIIVWADGDTFFGGHASTAAAGASGDGGFIEVSGKVNLAYRGTVDLGSLAGITGELLLDPGTVIIIDGPQNGAAQSGQLMDGMILATDGGPAATYTITTGDIAAFGGMVTIAAETLISDGGAMLNINAPNGIGFTVNNGNIGLGNSNVNTNGNDANFSAPNGMIAVNVVNSNGMTPGSSAGNISFNAINTSFMSVSAFGLDGDAGTPMGGNGGTVTITDSTAAGTGSSSFGNVLIYGGNGAAGSGTTPGGDGGNGGTFNVNAMAPGGGAFIGNVLNYFGGNGGSGNPPGTGGNQGSIGGTGTTPLFTGGQNGGNGMNGTLITPPPAGGGGDGFVDLGLFIITGNELVVELIDGGEDNLVVADAIRLEPLPDQNAQNANIGSASAGTIEANSFGIIGDPAFQPQLPAGFEGSVVLSSDGAVPALPGFFGGPSVFEAIADIASGAQDFPTGDAQFDSAVSNFVGDHPPIVDTAVVSSTTGAPLGNAETPPTPAQLLFQTIDEGQTPNLGLADAFFIIFDIIRRADFESGDLAQFVGDGGPEAEPDPQNGNIGLPQVFGSAPVGNSGFVTTPFQIGLNGQLVPVQTGRARGPGNQFETAPFALGGPGNLQQPLFIEDLSSVSGAIIRALVEAGRRVRDGEYTQEDGPTEESLKIEREIAADFEREVRQRFRRVSDEELEQGRKDAIEEVARAREKVGDGDGFGQAFIGELGEAEAFLRQVEFEQRRRAGEPVFDIERAALLRDEINKLEETLDEFDDPLVELRAELGSIR